MTLAPVDDPVQPYEEADWDDGHKDEVKPQNVYLQVDHMSYWDNYKKRLGEATARRSASRPCRW